MSVDIKKYPVVLDWDKVKSGAKLFVVRGYESRPRTGDVVIFLRHLGIGAIDIQCLDGEVHEGCYGSRFVLAEKASNPIKRSTNVR